MIGDAGAASAGAPEDGHASAGAPEASAHPAAPGPACQTCGDVAEAMVVVEVRAAAELAECRRVDGDEGADRVLVDTGLVGAVAAGEALLVHAGVALARAAT